MGNSGSNAEFNNFGDRVAGYLIEEPGEAQQTTFGENPQPKVYKNGQPAMMTILKLQTQENNGQPDDDGIRILCVADLSNRQQVIAQAVRRAGAPDVEIGGYLTLEYIGQGEPAQKGGIPPKLYAAQYVPPQPQQSGIMAGGPAQQVVQQAPVVQQQQPTQQYQQTPPPQQYQQPVQQGYAGQQFPNPNQGAPPSFVPNTAQPQQPVQQQAPPQQQPVQQYQQQAPVDQAAVQQAMQNLGINPQQ